MRVRNIFPLCFSIQVPGANNTQAVSLNGFFLDLLGAVRSLSGVGIKKALESLCLSVNLEGLDLKWGEKLREAVKTYQSLKGLLCH